MEKFITILKVQTQNFASLLLYTLIFVFPFFFLKTTQEFFATNKLYFLGFGILLLLLISTIQLIFSKKISWKKSSFDGPIILFLTSVVLSTFFAPNKIQSLLNLNFGTAMMIFLTILYFYISRNNEAMKQWNNLTIFVSVFLSLTTIILHFFLPGFTPVGSQLDLAILLGFFLIINVINIFKKGLMNQTPTKKIILNYSFFILNLLALFLTVYSLVKPNMGLINQAPTLILPPFRLSWFAALEIFKNPLTTIVGVGPDNFSYNQSPLWQINSFYISRSAFFQIITETGILGMSFFGLLVFSVFKSITKQWNNETMKPLFFVFIYLIICLFIFPSSLIVWFLFFVTLGLISQQSNNETMKQSVDFSNNLLIHVCIIIISLVLIAGVGYLLGRSYAGELFYKKSVDGIIKNDAKQAYENQRQAIILNPYIEKYHNVFAQINIIVAGNLAKKDPEKISQEERQIITQAVQMAISEGKQLVKLNSKKAQYWSNLGDIYVNIIPLAKDSDIWAIASYQRAIVLDPFNPVYQLNMGGIYYRIDKYKEAIPFFEEAIKLRPDWSNAHYNLAWANFQKQNYPQAVNSMQNALNLINPKTNKADYEKVQKELKEFKKMLPKK